MLQKTASLSTSARTKTRQVKASSTRTSRKRIPSIVGKTRRSLSSPSSSRSIEGIKDKWSERCWWTRAGTWIVSGTRHPWCLRPYRDMADLTVKNWSKRRYSCRFSRGTPCSRQGMTTRTKSNRKLRWTSEGCALLNSWIADLRSWRVKPISQSSPTVIASRVTKPHKSTAPIESISTITTRTRTAWTQLAKLRYRRGRWPKSISGISPCNKGRIIAGPYNRFDTVPLKLSLSMPRRRSTQTKRFNSKTSPARPRLSQSRRKWCISNRVPRPVLRSPNPAYSRTYHYSPKISRATMSSTFWCSNRIKRKRKLRSKLRRKQWASLPKNHSTWMWEWPHRTRTRTAPWWHSTSYCLRRVRRNPKVVSSTERHRDTDCCHVTMITI